MLGWLKIDFVQEQSEARNRFGARIDITALECLYLDFWIMNHITPLESTFDIIALGIFFLFRFLFCGKGKNSCFLFYLTDNVVCFFFLLLGGDLVDFSGCPVIVSYIYCMSSNFYGCSVILLFLLWVLVFLLLVIIVLVILLFLLQVWSVSLKKNWF